MNRKSLTEHGQDSLTKMKIVSSIVKEKFSLFWSINHFGEYLDREYEFISPEFLSNSSRPSKWKLVVFPELVYPKGVQIILRMFNASNDNKCYSVHYTVSLFDKNDKEHVLRHREKVFRYYLDYDQCSVASNSTIKSKSFLQADGTLTICCEIDLLLCESPNDETAESAKSYENNSVPVTNDREKHTKSGNINSPVLNDLSVIDKNLIKSENINNSLLSPKKSDEGVKVINSLSEINDNVFPTSMVKMDKRHFNKERSPQYKRPETSPYEPEKKTSGLSEKIDSFLNKTRGKVIQESSDSKNLKCLGTLSKDLKFLYTTKYQYDVIIHTKDGQIPAHKAILSARSEYFRKLPEDKEIEISEINSATLDSILFHMYTGQSPQMPFNLAIDILKVCNQFRLHDLNDAAQDSIKSQMNISNVTDIFQIATEMKLENLKMSALKFIANNSEAVTNSAKWNEMASTDPHGAGEILITIASFKKTINRR